ncbi:MAG TPA: hypothetical protein VI874_02390 [Candidatus Norongarragalinales archaeon]|nr:hypothetical protein [Candidatus Norongarragalinales archaeon]
MLLFTVFSAVFFIGQAFFKPSVIQILDGVRVIGSKEDFAQILAVNPVRVEMRLFSGNDTRNTDLTKVTADVASTLVQYGKRVYVYGSVDEKPAVNCIQETLNCSGAVIRVVIGPCNCLSAETGLIRIEATPDFLADFSHIKVFKGVLGLAVAG